MSYRTTIVTTFRKSGRTASGKKVATFAQKICEVGTPEGLASICYVNDTKAPLPISLLLGVQP
eukprot:scaffold2288_cov87-Cylindrotheca_fusiformis.AAC.8